MPEPEREAQEALTNWRVSLIEGDLREVPADGIWHYTGANALRSILEQEKLWATDARFLNDETELHYGLELAEEAVDAVIRSERWKKSTNDYLRRLIASNGAHATGFLRARSEVFVSCFCADGDLLSQWRAYGAADVAGGYALQLRHRAPLTGWIDHRGRTTLRIHRVIYGRETQLAAISSLVDMLAPIYDTDPSERRQAALGRVLVEGILEMASYFNHPSFSEEREWRVVYKRSSDPEPLEVKHRVARGIFIPYVELELPAAVGAMAGHLPVVAIRCGPSSEPTLKNNGVRRLLRSIEAYKHIDVLGTESPLRL